MSRISGEKDSDVRSLGYSILHLVDAILVDIEEPLKKKKPDVKTALLEIDGYRNRANKLREFWENEKSLRNNNSSYMTKKVQTYNCLYQCGFTTHSIREIDKHLTKEHGHPDPKRDYSHPIYNES